jgi:hypothetical protein
LGVGVLGAGERRGRHDDVDEHDARRYVARQPRRQRERVLRLRAVVEATRIFVNADRSAGDASGSRAWRSASSCIGYSARDGDEAGAGCAGPADAA